MSAPSAIAWGVGGCLLMAGLPVCVLIGGARSASCSLGFEQSVAGRLFLGLDGCFRGRCSWLRWAVLAFWGCGVVCCDASFLCGLFVCLGRPKSRVDAWGAAWSPRAGSLASALASSKKSPTREPTLAAAEHPWDD